MSNSATIAPISASEGRASKRFAASKILGRSAIAVIKTMSARTGTVRDQALQQMTTIGFAQHETVQDSARLLSELMSEQPRQNHPEKRAPRKGLGLGQVPDHEYGSGGKVNMHSGLTKPWSEKHRE